MGGSDRYMLPIPEDEAIDASLASFLLTEPIQEGGKELNATSAAGNSLTLSEYTVKSGDTVEKIAKAHQLNIDTVISFNNLRRINAIKAGMPLLLPNKNGLMYKVSRGDALTLIARRYGIPLNSILDNNNLTSDLIHPGQTLFLPNAHLSIYEMNLVMGTLFIYPTTGRFTSRFGYRKDPFTGVRSFHYGLDLANHLGTPIKAAMAGTVAMIGVNPGFGNYIILKHDNSFQTLYGHLSEVLVTRGQYVPQGFRIGLMGSTGYSTGSHLHFSIFKNNIPIYHLKYLY
jgi:murein DD-endopeptidase MepM/ murein hydrolase activator NlpD